MQFSLFQLRCMDCKLNDRAVKLQFISRSVLSMFSSVQFCLYAVHALRHEKLQTDDDEAHSSTCQCHVDLMLVTYEAELSQKPAVRRTRVNLILRQ